MTDPQELRTQTRDQLVMRVLELEAKEIELTRLVMDYQRGYSNACVMRDHWQKKYESIVKQN